MSSFSSIDIRHFFSYGRREINCPSAIIEMRQEYHRDIFRHPKRTEISKHKFTDVMSPHLTTTPLPIFRTASEKWCIVDDYLLEKIGCLAEPIYCIDIQRIDKVQMERISSDMRENETKCIVKANSILKLYLAAKMREFELKYQTFPDLLDSKMNALKLIIEETSHQISDLQIIYLEQLTKMMKYSPFRPKLRKERRFNNSILLSQKRKLVDLVKTKEYPIKLAAKRCKIRLSSAFKIMKIYKERDIVMDTNKKRNVFKESLSSEHIEYIEQLLSDKNLRYTVPQIQRALEEKHLLKTERSTLYYYLKKRLGYTY